MDRLVPSMAMVGTREQIIRFRGTVGPFYVMPAKRAWLLLSDQLRIGSFRAI
jgi:hypothetical protein